MAQWVVKTHDAALDGSYPLDHTFGPFESEEKADAFRDSLSPWAALRERDRSVKAEGLISPEDWKYWDGNG